ncbi:MAG: hypothetical protein JW717_06475 [Marinilabiliaceae bacterium]|nr:hypothetical protein [Marinilabiliaceae bacterium]
MKCCKNCGVELDSNMIICPLCNQYVDNNRLQEKTQIQELESTSNIQSSIEKNRLFVEVSAIVLGSGVLITLFIDWLVHKSITWSYYNLIASATLFANITVIIFRNRLPYLFYWASFITNSAFLIIIDNDITDIDWSIKLAIPIMLSFYINLILLTRIIKLIREKGFNIPAIFLIATGLFLMITESFISLYLYNVIVLKWSLIVAVSIIPVTISLFYIHFRLKKRIDLKRFFNI